MMKIGTSKLTLPKNVMYAQLTDNFKHAMKLKLNKLVNKEPEGESSKYASPVTNIDNCWEVKQSFSTATEVAIRSPRP